MALNKAMLFNRIVENGLYKEFLSFALYMRFNKGYSLFNSALILLQRPGTEYLETEDGWKKLERFVKPNAIPIVVVHPFGPVNFIYDLEDTYGKEVPNYMRPSFIYPELSELTGKCLKQFVSVVNMLGIFYGEKPFGSRQAGQAERLENGIELEVPESELFIDGIQKNLFDKSKQKSMQKVITHYAITTNSSLSDAQKASAILHEIGHILCGHLGSGKDNQFLTTPNRKGESLTKRQKEFEAEKVCEMVSAILSIDCNSRAYLQEYLEEDGSEPLYSLRTVIEAADKIVKYFR